MDSLLHASTSEIARAIRAREVSSEEVVRACIERIERINPKINAVVQSDPEGALQQARVADQKLGEGYVPGPLHGVPMTLKDAFQTAGMVTTAGTTGLAGHVPDNDAVIVKRLRSAGAILLGKTNTPEITLSGVTDNHVYGQTNNPYDLKRSAGGSSGGAAAAVATGMVPFDIGTDTGGSIRIPAHCCGVVGLKPSAGRVPRTGMIPPPSMWMIGLLTQVGPISRRVEDLSLLLRIISGEDFADPAVVPLTLESSGGLDDRTLRVAWYDDNSVDPPDDDTRHVLSKAVAVLREEGLIVSQDRPPAVVIASELWRNLMCADGGATVRQLLREFGTDRMHPLIEWTQEGRDMPASDLTHLLGFLADQKSSNLQWFRSYDVIVCPVESSAAPKHGDRPSFSYTYVYNLLGWPVVTLPCGMNSAGLPVGLQIVARPWRDDIAIHVAEVLEERLGGWHPPDMAPPGDESTTVEPTQLEHSTSDLDG